MSDIVKGGYKSPSFGKKLITRNDKTAAVTAEELQEALARSDHFDEIVKLVAEDRKDMKAELAAAGFNMKAFNRLVADRKRKALEGDDADALMQMQMLVEDDGDE